MTVPVVVVQARMGSSRLPGKVLQDLGGRPMLALMLERLRPVVEAGARVVVATSDLDRDDPVADLARAIGVVVVRGSEGDVLARFGAVLDAFPTSVVVRLTGDCPLVDPGLVLDALALHAATGAAYTSNTLERRYPDGLDVEVIAAEALRVAVDEALASEEREHVTPFVIRRPCRFTIAQLSADSDRGLERWTVDTTEDLEFLRDATAGIDLSVASWRDLVDPLARPTDESGPVARVLTGPRHHPGAPYERWWTLLDGRRLVGSASLTVTDVGRGRLEVDLAAGPEADGGVIARRTAAAAVRTRLAADLQVIELVEEPPEGP